MIESQLLTKVKNEFDAALLQYKQDLKEYKEKFENEFQTEWSKKKFKWFFKKRRQRKLKYKIYRRHCKPIFELMEDMINDISPKAIEISFDNFADIKDIAHGDKNYFSEEELVDKINSFGCTSFNMTPAEIQRLELIDENELIEKFRQNTFEAGGCSLIKEESSNDI